VQHIIGIISRHIIQLNFRVTNFHLTKFSVQRNIFEDQTEFKTNIFNSIFNDILLTQYEFFLLSTRLRSTTSTEV